MIWLALTGGLFLLLLLFPILLASFWYFHSKDSVLPVRQNRSRDPRYFAKSFDKLFQEAWPNRDGEMIALSRPKPEPYYRADDMDLEDYSSPCSRLVVAEQAELAPPAASASSGRSTPGGTPASARGAGSGPSGPKGTSCWTTTSIWTAGLTPTGPSQSMTTATWGSASPRPPPSPWGKTAVSGGCLPR